MSAWKDRSSPESGRSSKSSSQPEPLELRAEIPLRRGRRVQWVICTRCGARPTPQPGRYVGGMIRYPVRAYGEEDPTRGWVEVAACCSCELGQYRFEHLNDRGFSVRFYDQIPKAEGDSGSRAIIEEEMRTRFRLTAREQVKTDHRFWVSMILGAVAEQTGSNYPEVAAAVFTNTAILWTARFRQPPETLSQIWETSRAEWVRRFRELHPERIGAMR